MKAEIHRMVNKAIWLHF